MHYRELGAAGVDVSEIGFGAWTVGTDWWGDRTDEEAKEMLRYAHDQGITYFDTGDVYGHGHSEELVGEALAPIRDRLDGHLVVRLQILDHVRNAHPDARRPGQRSDVDHGERVDGRSVSIGDSEAVFDCRRRRLAPVGGEQHRIVPVVPDRSGP